MSNPSNPLFIAVANAQVAINAAQAQLSTAAVDLANALALSIIPTAPTGLITSTKTTFGGLQSITIGCDLVPGALGYNYFIAESPDGPFTLVASSPANQGNSFAGKTAGTSYYFQMSAFNGNGESPRSATVVQVA